ncbi:FIG140336: TPR domain protein [hydrothermal vent metagenome]|uniref:FIG140336: TPR domain protein n=1 Tax=hydrothermal vent metagenome TaxID=652676 RepID=A0A3B1A8V9_9ZZZZ
MKINTSNITTKSAIALILSVFLQACSTPAPVTSVKQADFHKKNEPIKSQAKTTKSIKPDKTAKEPKAAQITEKVIPQVEESPQISAELLFRLMTAEVAGQRGNLAVAVQQYNQAALLSQDPKIAERATQIAIFSRDNDSALNIAKHWVKIDPDNPEVHQVLGSMYLRQGNVDVALFHFEKVIELGKNNQQQGFMLITSLLSKERDKTTALEVMKKLVGSRHQNAFAQFAYGQLASLFGELDVAVSALNQVVLLQPKWTKAQILRGNVLFRQKKKLKAFNLLVSVLEENPSNTELRMYYARKLVDDKRLNEARKQFELVLNDQGDNIDATFAVALLSLRSGDLDYAETKFLKLVERKQREDEASYYLGQIAEHREKYSEARRWYSVIDSGHYYIDAKIKLAMIIAREENVAVARKFLQDLTTQSAEQELRILVAEGELLRKAKNYGEAFNHYTESLASMPDNTQLLYARALMADKLNRLDVAEDDLKNILAREPNNAQALNALGYTLADRTDRYAEALEYIERAHRLRPNDAAIKDSLGWIQYRLGNTSEAIKYLREAFKLMKDPEIAAHLGEVLWVMGEQESAKALWDDALKATPDHELLLHVIERFKK